MSRFYFSGDSGSISSESDEDNLPYPEALPRSDFLTSDFDAPTYLSTLSERHQTLEDLRSDLRERSQALSKELLDLVNTNYEQFLGLGSNLKGGEEKVEDVRVGLLGFRTGVEEIGAKVSARGQEVDLLLVDKTKISRQVMTGRQLLEADSRLEELEERLMMASVQGRNVIGLEDGTWSDSDEEEDDENEIGVEEPGTGTTTKKLHHMVQDFRHIEHIFASVGSRHPFIVAQEARLIRIKNTLLLDLSTALKDSYSAHGDSKPARLLKILALYSDIGLGAEAIKLLRTLKT